MRPAGFISFRRRGEATGALAAEAEAKREVLCWRPHEMLADLAGEIDHYKEAALARPESPSGRAALGCAPCRAGRLDDAVPHLRAAAAGNPFDLRAARAPYQALVDAGHREAASALASERRLLHRAAPGVVPAEGWFAPRRSALVSLVILRCNEAVFSRLCLESVRRHARAPHELVLVDNGSTDETPAIPEEAKGWPEPARVEVVTNARNVGFPAGCKQGIAAEPLAASSSS